MAAKPTFLLNNYPRFVQFEPLATKGALYMPDDGSAATIAFLAIHRTANFMSLIATRELAVRGFMVLGMNPRSDNNEASVNFENVAFDIKQGVEFLRRQPGVRKVILIGHSGGGPAATFYQATAERGPAFCGGSQKLSAVAGDFANLPPADGMLLLDAHPGNPINTMRSLNPAVLDEDEPVNIDSALDPFDPKNGFNADGQSIYAPEFMDRYFKAQAARMNRLIERALVMRDNVRQGRGKATDDAPFIIYRARARLVDFSSSPNVCTKVARKLLKNDGSIVTDVIRSVRVPSMRSAKQDKTLLNGTRMLTLTSFLTANAIRAKHSIENIDWQTSNNSTPPALAAIRVPILIAAMGAHYFICDNEYHYDVAASLDKDFVVVEGATHGMTPCDVAAKSTGVSYSNATKNLYDYVANWTHSRFSQASG